MKKKWYILLLMLFAICALSACSGKKNADAVTKKDKKIEMPEVEEEKRPPKLFCPLGRLIRQPESLRG